MISTVYKRMFSVLKKRFFSLLGVLLLAIILWFVSSIAVSFIPLAQLSAAAQSWARASRTSSTGVPLLMYLLMTVVYALWFCVLLLLSASMSKIYLGCCRTRLAPNVSDLFAMFRTGQFFRILGGMAWMCLWIFLWSLIPIVGIVFGIIRMYEYRFVPYILMTRDDVKPTDAIKISKQETMGYKGKMFGADILLGAVYLGAFLVFALLGEIPYLGVLFRILWVLIAIAYGLLAPLFSGIMQAAFYVEIQNRRAAGSWHPAAPARPDWPTPPVQPVQPSAPVQPERPIPPTQPVQSAAPEQPVCPVSPVVQPSFTEAVTQPASQGAPVVFSPEPEPQQPPEEPVQTQPSDLRCPRCGAAVKIPGAMFCTICGERLK